MLVTGTGSPTTLFAHGFAGSIAETRPFGSGVEGTRVFFHFSGHGTSPDPADGLGYAALETELRVVADAHGATRALGVSLGAGALLAAVAHEPSRFDRLVLVIPAAIDRPRTGRAVARVEAMADRAEAGDVDGLTRLLLAEQPAELRERRVVQVWAHQQAARMAGPALVSAMRVVPQLFPLADRAALAAVEVPVLVIGQEGDEAHPAELVGELVAALPHAEGHVFSPGGVVWTHRADLRRIITGFLND